ncbi:hypothetical protein HYC85_026044 [Camellia sinensis]|uniref:Isopenicillin N synthase-like Fe(2+) 2OG dioxygenase domain-containing protein n=1 Tax=Camellia sinensis TaxID=4442 RepID=A0A7J7G3M3_CAMSI|nr:hypothetical protein HYC85_026044 [Camellia sinensis]
MVLLALSTTTTQQQRNNSSSELRHCIVDIFFGKNLRRIRQIEVAKAVSRIIALALDLEVDFFDRQEMLGKPIAILRLLHYEGRVSDPMKGIRDKDAKPQKWEFVAPLKGAFIVNLGDMLEHWSNCIFRLNTFWSLVMIVPWNACPPTSHKRTLPSKMVLGKRAKFTLLPFGLSPEHFTHP